MWYIYLYAGLPKNISFEDLLRLKVETWMELMTAEFWHTSRQKQSPKLFCKKAVLKNFAIFTGKHLCWCLFLIKLQDFRPVTFIKNRLQHRCFTVNIAKFSRTSILKNICERIVVAFECSFRRAGFSEVISTSYGISNFCKVAVLKPIIKLKLD